MNTAQRAAADDIEAPGYEPDGAWVPVDRRWCGLDRRSLVPTLWVMALAVVLTVVIPAVDDAVSYDDPVQPGDVFELDGDITFVPEPGWGITSGVRADRPPVSGSFPNTASVVDGDVAFTVTVGDFRGDENALLDQVAKTTDALTGGSGATMSEQRTTITTDDGEVGVTAPLSVLSTDGMVAAFVLGDRGVVVRVTGPADGDPDSDQAVSRMLDSISRSEQAAA